MTAIAMKREQTVLIDGLTELIGKCQNASFADVLRNAALKIKSNQIQSGVRRTRLSDEELETILANEPEFSIDNYSEPTEEEWHEMIASSKERI